MATLEQVEKLRQKVDCSYEEAKAALEACDDDMLEAIIYLEKKGKESKDSSGSGSYSTKDGEQHTYSESSRTTHTTYTSSDNGSFVDGLNRFFAWLGRLIKQGNANYLDIINHDKVVLSIPLTILVLLMIFFFWFMLPALIIGLFCGLRYHFRGKDFQDSSKANDFMNDASKAAESTKQKVKEEFSDNKEKDDPYANDEGNDDKAE